MVDNNKNWSLLTSDTNISPYPIYLYLKSASKYYSIFRNNFLIVFSENNMRVYVRNHPHLHVGKIFFNQIKKNYKDFYNFEKKYIKNSNNLLKFSEKIKKYNLNKLDTSRLYKLYKKYNDLYEIHCSYSIKLNSLEIEQPLLSQYLKDKLRNYGKNIESAFEQLTALKKPSVIEKERNELLKLSEYIKKNKIKKNDFLKNDYISNKIKKMVNNYGYLSYGYQGPSANKDYYISRVYSLAKIRAKKPKKILYKSKDPLYAVMSEVYWLRSFSKFETAFKSRENIDSLIKELSKRLMLSSGQFRFMTTEEVERAVYKELDFTKVINKRMKICAFMSSSNNIKVLYEKDINKLLKDNKSRIKTKTSILHGMCAYKGTATGIVKVVNSVSDISKVKKGDIIVSFSTNPNLVPALEKAAAIVTDAGGMTSHAAIISRELLVPCVVGTKFATEILKDGDMVNVDASNGIVKKIMN